MTGRVLSDIDGNHGCPAACDGEPLKNNSIDHKIPMLERMDK